MIGNPLHVDGVVSTGIVSSIRQNEFTISAAISPGSSGSPVLNEQGLVIGMVSASFKRGQNLNFCIDIGSISSTLFAATSGQPVHILEHREVMPADSETKPTSAKEHIPRLVVNFLHTITDGPNVDLSQYCTAQIEQWYNLKNISYTQAQRQVADDYKKWPTQTTSWHFEAAKISGMDVSSRGLAYCTVWIRFHWEGTNATGKHLVRNKVIKIGLTQTSNGDRGYRIYAIDNVKI